MTLGAESYFNFIKFVRKCTKVVSKRSSRLFFILIEKKEKHEKLHCIFNKKAAKLNLGLVVTFLAHMKID